MNQRSCPKCFAQVESDLKRCPCGQTLAPPAMIRMPETFKVGLPPAGPVSTPRISEPPVVEPPRGAPPHATPPPVVGWVGALPGPAIPRRAISPASIDLVFDTGARVRPSGPGLIGRNPESGDTTAGCTTISDPDFSVSKIHLEYGVDAQGVWVQDRGSTNGSSVIREGLPWTRLEPGKPFYLQVGDTVIFGRRRFTVEEGRPS